MTEITVTCPSDRAVDVAREIAATHKLTTSLPEQRFVAVGTKSGVHSLETVTDSSVSQYRTFNVDRNTRPDQQDSFNASAGLGVDELKSVDDVPARGGTDERFSEHRRVLMRNAETLARVMHHVSELANSWVDLARFHASPSHPGLDNPSVGERPGSGGNPAGPGHLDGRA